MSRLVVGLEWHLAIRDMATATARWVVHSGVLMTETKPSRPSVIRRLNSWLENSTSGAGPKLTLFVLIPIAVCSLGFIISGFFQQRYWHQIENEQKEPKVSMLIESTLVHDGWTHGILEIENRMPVDIEIQTVELLSPRSLQIAPQDPTISNTSNGGPIIAKASNILSFQKMELSRSMLK